MDINTKKLKKNSFRVSKVRGRYGFQSSCSGRVAVMQTLCSRWWILPENMETDRSMLTTRQGFEIEGIHMEDMDKVNEMLQPIIDNLQINQK